MKIDSKNNKVYTVHEAVRGYSGKMETNLVCELTEDEVKAVNNGSKKIKEMRKFSSEYET